MQKKSHIPNRTAVRLSSLRSACSFMLPLLLAVSSVARYVSHVCVRWVVDDSRLARRTREKTLPRARPSDWEGPRGVEPMGGLGGNSCCVFRVWGVPPRPRPRRWPPLPTRFLVYSDALWVVAPSKLLEFCGVLRNRAGRRRCRVDLARSCIGSEETSPSAGLSAKLCRDSLLSSKSMSSVSRWSLTWDAVAKFLTAKWTECTEFTEWTECAELTELTEWVESSLRESTESERLTTPGWSSAVK